MSTALAFDYFDQSDVEVAVIETGLGGRLDATNLIIPIVSVITNIDSTTWPCWATRFPKSQPRKRESSKSIPVVIGEKSDEYNHVFDQAATAMMSKIVYAENDFACINHSTEGISRNSASSATATTKFSTWNWTLRAITRYTTY